MMTKRRKNDVRYLISAILLIAAVAAAVTGFLADIWDVNDFVVHTYAGYGMAVLALVHTVLEGPRLWGYVRSRLRRRARPPAPVESSTPPPEEATGTVLEKAKTLLSRRDLLSLLIGGAGGFILGRQRASHTPLPERADLGMQYHAWSKPGVPNPLAPLRDWGQRPPQYKSYPNAPSIPLPAVGDAQGLSLEAAIRQRRSIRAYAATPMTLKDLSSLLFYTDGINAERGGTRLRAAPSAGALYPVETYIVAHRVEGLAAGLYHYTVQDHRLVQLHAGALDNEVVRAGIMQGFLGEANITLILTAIFQRLRWKYQERAYRYALLETGHIGQNIYLAATSMGMGACAVGAFDDDAVNALVGVDGINEAAIYLLAVGEVR